MHVLACACTRTQPLDLTLTCQSRRPAPSPAHHYFKGCQSHAMWDASCCERRLRGGVDGPERCTCTPCKHAWKHHARHLPPPPTPTSATKTPQQTKLIPKSIRGAWEGAPAGTRRLSECTVWQAATFGVSANCASQPWPCLVLQKKLLQKSDHLRNCPITCNNRPGGSDRVQSKTYYKTHVCARVHCFCYHTAWLHVPCTGWLPSYCSSQ